MTQFIVTTSAAGLSRSQVWNPSNPLGLGHPLRWIAELTERGVRIRSLASKPGEISTGSIAEIPRERLRAGEPELEVTLPHAKGFSIRIRSVERLAPAFGRKSGKQGGERLSIFSCQGSWAQSSSLFEDRYQGFAGTAGRDGATERKAVFSLREKGGTYSFDMHVPDVSVRVGEEPATVIAQGEATHVKADRIADTVVAYGNQTWRFGLSQAVEMPARAEEAIHDAEALWFKKALRAAAVGFGAFMAMTWLWPKPQLDTKELIPAQYAKIVLAKPAAPDKTKASASEGNPTLSKSSAPEKVQKAAVVQAFRAKALSSAVSGLLKGGMTSLLAQSDFVAGKGATADARRIFDSKSAALASTGPSGAVAADTNRAVAALGGTGLGKGAGYAKGEKAGVKGQGQAFVSMDIAGAAVDEGLTKDEVGEVIHRHLSEVRYCYESAMIRTPDLEGKLMVNFTIGGAGAVKSTEVKSSTVPDPRLDDCILRRLTTWKFPTPRGGIDVAVTYPFIFKTLGR